MRFSKGDKVIYPNHGVGIVEDIRERKIADADQEFYHLRIVANDTMVMVPVGNSENVGLRKILAKKEVQELYDYLSNGDVETYSNWKGRYKENAEKMRSGHLYEVADVLKSLVYLSERKTLSYREKRMYEKAKFLIISEVAMVEGRREDKVEGDIEEALEESVEKKKEQVKRRKEKEEAEAE